MKRNLSWLTTIFAGGFVLAAVLLALVLIGAVSSQAAEKPQPRAASILGLTRVGGQEVIVEIVVAVTARRECSRSSTGCSQAGVPRCS